MAKGPDAFRTISEASEELGVPQHVLRFWETKFSFVKPMKRAGGRRFYRPADIAVLAGVRRLLHEQGYTIKGVQKLHREKGLGQFAPSDDTVADAPAHAPPRAAPAPESRALVEAATRLRGLRAGLERAKAELDAVLAPR